MPQDQFQPTQPPPTNNLNKQNVPNLPINKKKLIFLFLVFIFFLLATSAITLRKSQTLPPQPFTSQLEIMPTPKPLSISTQDDISKNWKTYRNNNFSFYYPNTWSDPEESQISTGNIITIQDGGETEDRIAKFEIIDRFHFDQVTQKTKTFQEFEENFKPTRESSTKEPYHLGNLQGFRHTYYVSGPSYYVTEIFIADSKSSTRIISIIYRHDSTEYESSIPQTLTQILSTFEFLE